MQLFKIRYGILCMIHVAVKIQSPQKTMVTLDWNNKDLATFNKCWCFLSTTKFYFDVQGNEN